MKRIHMKMSDGQTDLPHAGSPTKGNPVDGSDRVKASVAGAGFMDCEGSQTSLRVDHLAQNATSEDKQKQLPQDDMLAEKRRLQREKLVQRHYVTLDKLSKYFEGRHNIHYEIKRMVASLSSSWQQIQEIDEEEGRMQRPTSSVDTQTTPRLMEDGLNTADGNVEVMDIVETPKARRVSQAKRRRDLQTPQSTEQEEKKRKASQQPPPGRPLGKPSSEDPEGEEGVRKPEEEGWQTAGKKKKKAGKKAKAKPAQQPRKQRGRPTLPNALVIEKKGDFSYAEILSRLKKDESLKDAGECVQKIRRTNAGKLLIVLTKNSSEKTSEVHRQIQDALGQDASLTSRVQEMDIELKDLAEDTTNEDVFAAIQRELGPEVTLTKTCVRSLRSVYDKTQIAVVRLALPAAKKLLDLKRIRVPWGWSKIREIVKPLKCFRCWAFGHLARDCKGKTDRSKCCMKCGGDGHKVAECTAEPRCPLCAEKGEQKSVSHIAGSSRCPAYTRALQATLKRRQ